MLMLGQKFLIKRSDADILIRGKLKKKKDPFSNVTVNSFRNW